MAVMEEKASMAPRVDAAALFEKLGLKLADPRPIRESWKAANAAWKRQRMRIMAEHSRRITDHLTKVRRGRRCASPESRSLMGKKRPVWCVELGLYFRSLTAAARFVNRQPSNISQSIARGVRCGTFHWEDFDAKTRERNRV